MYKLAIGVVAAALTQLVVLGQPIEILFQPQHSQDACQHPEAGREVASLEAGQGVSRHIDARGQLGKRHATPETSEAQPLAKRLSAALSLRK